MSSIESALATNPRTSPVNLHRAYAPRRPRHRDLWPDQVCHCRTAALNSSTGTRPSHDTQFGPSNDAYSAEGA
jgi:hypothetical protein